MNWSRVFLIGAGYLTASVAAFIVTARKDPFDLFESDYQLVWFVLFPLVALFFLSGLAIKSGRKHWVRHAFLALWIAAVTYAHFWWVVQMAAGV